MILFWEHGVMVKKFSLMGVAAAALLAGGVSANAAVIDFTALPVGTTGPLMGSVGGTSWVLTGSSGQVQTPQACDGPANGLACVNDGVGIAGSEISGNNKAYATITFSKQVALVAAYFYDLFIARDGNNAESIYITNGASPSLPADADVTVNASEVFKTNNGFKLESGFKLVGTTFTFFVDPNGNDNVGRPDAALAALEIAPVPLPAGGLLIASALGGLGLLRRKQKKARLA
ncbi:VPLPA-CTERM sorting domain-containing protein [Paracoccus actinidiae]|uniref:VPLPA-CTERM sorting domain-containing protein n=1 Tax=Paracoccus actinidiae TaxID=3064531 RepID=UPI0027D20943|nr:VPLPA-CTERM sorting domain-containing protein [Paracoccus sp. M09]